jgi:hypothetical protein
MNCPECKKDISTAFSRPLDGSCEVCSTAELMPALHAVPRAGFIAWCVNGAERASGPVYRFFPPARRWSYASMGENAFKAWCRSELKKAGAGHKRGAREPIAPAVPVSQAPAAAAGARLALFDPAAFVLVSVQGPTL